MDDEKSVLEKLTDTVKDAAAIVVDGVKSMADPASGTPLQMPLNESGADIRRAARPKTKTTRKPPAKKAAPAKKATKKKPAKKSPKKAAKKTGAKKSAVKKTSKKAAMKRKRAKKSKR